MINLCEFTIIGNVGNVRAFEKSTVVSVGAHLRRRDPNGEWKTITRWNQVTVFNPRTRDYIKNKITVGMLVMTRGYPEHTSYEKDGKTVYGTSLVATSFSSIEATRDEPEEEQPSPSPTRSSRRPSKYCQRRAA